MRKTSIAENWTAVEELRTVIARLVVMISNLNIVARSGFNLLLHDHDVGGDLDSQHRCSS